LTQQTAQRQQYRIERAKAAHAQNALFNHLICKVNHMAYPQTYVDLLDRLSRRGCPVCGLLLHNEHQYLDSLLYEFVNDTGIQQSIRRGRGLCNHHSWLLTQHYGYSLGVSILCEAALDEVISLDSENSPFHRSKLGTTLSNWFGGDTRLADKLEPEIPCPACDSLRIAETQYIATFAEYWSDSALQSAYQQSNGLCLPHFREVLRHIPAPEARADLINQFQVKSAFNYVGEPIGAEADCWRRAVAALTGGEHALLTLTRPR
jgi:hypothetical protein